MRSIRKKRKHRWLWGCVWWLCALACAGALTLVGYCQQVLPDRYTVSRGQDVYVGGWVQSDSVTVRDSTLRVSAVPAGGQYRTRLTLGGLIPIKEVTVNVTEETVVMVCGSPFGIKLYTKGVLVVGLSDVDTAAGKVNPAAAAGVCVGDTILAVNGQAVASGWSGTGWNLTPPLRRCGRRATTLTAPDCGCGTALPVSAP